VTLISIYVYGSIILSVVLYGCETWSLALRIFVNKVLKRIFGPKRDDVRGEWRKLHNEDFTICTPHPIMFGF
jgi:hypothetical protein